VIPTSNVLMPESRESKKWFLKKNNIKRSNTIIKEASD
jgi:hypothetical protein